MVVPLRAKAGFNGFRSFWHNFHLILLLALQWWEPSIPFTQLPSCCPSWDETPALLALVLSTSKQKWFFPPWHCCLDAQWQCLPHSIPCYVHATLSPGTHPCHLHGIRDHYADWVFPGRGYLTAFLAGLGQWEWLHHQNCCFFLLLKLQVGPWIRLSIFIHQYF